MNGFIKWIADHSKQIGIGLTVLGGGITVASALTNAYNNEKEMNRQINEAVSKEIDRRLPPTTT